MEVLGRGSVLPGWLLQSASSTAAMAPASGLMESSMRCSAAGRQRAFRPERSCSSFSASVSARRPVLAGSLGSTAGVFFGARSAKAHTAQRRHAVRRAATCQAAAEKFTVAITGATGLVGSRLVAKLAAQGHTARVLTRNMDAARAKLPFPRTEFFAPPQWGAAVYGARGVVNLAGEPIGTRWTPAIKAEIKRSRVGVTRAIVDAIKACPEGQRPEVLVSTSAIGYYGASQTQTFSEASGAGADYLAEVCREWEAEAQRSPTRTVIVRTGIVLAKEGGALGKMLPVFNIFAGGPLGTGRQWCSWIHRDDLVNLYIAALVNPSFDGVYNATAPNPVRMTELCSALGSTLGRPSWIPVPAFALATLLGAGASVVLEGQRVLPKRTADAGFRFQFAHVGPALASIFR